MAVMMRERADSCWIHVSQSLHTISHVRGGAFYVARGNFIVTFCIAMIFSANTFQPMNGSQRIIDFTVFPSQSHRCLDRPVVKYA